MDDYPIPICLQGQLHERAGLVQRKFFPKASWTFVTVVQGKFVYLRRWMKDGSDQNLDRLIYDGNIGNMTFAIYRNNTEKYDSKADFKGAHHLDGTIEGALKALSGQMPSLACVPISK